MLPNRIYHLDGTSERMGEVRWCSPFHTKRSHGEEYIGIQSPRLDAGAGKKRLTDKAIARYMKKGYYGGHISILAKLGK